MVEFIVEGTMEYLESKVVRRLLKGAGIALPLLLLALLVLALPVSANPGKSATLSAPTVTLDEEATFNVPISIEDTGDVDMELNAFQFDIVVDPDTLTLNSTTAGTLISGWTVLMSAKQTGAPHEGSDWWRIDGYTGAGSSVSGDGQLVVLNFTAAAGFLDTESTVLNLDTCTLSDMDAIEIPSTLTDGSATVDLLEVTVWVDAPAEATVGSDFIVRVDIANVTDLDAAVFRVRFNPVILDLPTTDADSNNIYDSITGGVVGEKTVGILATVWKEPGLIGVTAQVQPALSGATGNGYLAELHFHALSPGTSNIGLEHHSLSNKYAESIPATWKDGSVTTLSPPTVTPAVGVGAPTYYTKTNLFGMAKSYRIRYTGEILKTIEATSEDGMLAITIPKGTVALGKDGKRLKGLETAVDESPPDPPEGAHIIELAYDFGPEGATFDPPITFTWSYDPGALPEGVAEEDLVLAYYIDGEWVELDCVVDTENNTITASVAHFTTIAIIGFSPAAFTSSSLAISPAEVAPAERVSISISVANTGGREGSYTVVLKLNGVKEAEKSVRIAAGESQVVSFSVAKEDAGSYSVTVDGLSGSFSIVVPPAPPPPAPPPVPPPPPPPPALAAFALSISIQPAEVQPKQTVTITVSVANTGGTEGSYSVVLKINGVKEAEKSVTVAAGKSQEVSFSVSKEDAGSYSVTVDGLSGSFTILAPAPPAPMPIYYWFIIGAVAVALIVFGIWVVRRRRDRKGKAAREESEEAQPK